MFNLLLDMVNKLRKDVAAAGDCFGSASGKAASNERERKSADLDSVGAASAFYHEQELRQHGQSIPCWRRYPCCGRRVSLRAGLGI